MAAAHNNVDLSMLLHSDKSRKSVDKEKLRLDEQVVNCIRCLAMDAVQNANSGHPGTPMAMAPVAYAIWSRLLRYDPEAPHWANRDRFVLSVGHASMLIYGLLHLAGVKEVDRETNRVLETPAVSLDDIKAFRQVDSKCPGHPEYAYTTGVETTTGPLGQGIANSVGMAAASKWFGATFNRPDFELFGYDVYALCGDGDLQEGVSHEAASLAAHWHLDNLCWVWDNNQITIEGNTAWAFSDDMATRFVAYGWNVIRVGDANDVQAMTRALGVFKLEKQRPTLIIVDSHIAWGAPTMQDSFTAHGTPLGDAEIAETKAVYKWPNEKFLVPEEVLKHFRGQLAERGGVERRTWEAQLAKYAEKYPKEASTLQHVLNGTLPDGWDEHCKEFKADAKGLATRQSSSECLNMVGKGVPWLMGGSADLATSCLTAFKFPGADDFMSPTSGWGHYGGRNMHFGIREHAMGSIINGLSLSGVRPFGSTFLVFSDYMKPPMRMSAIMEINPIWIFTHDSIGVGEDGPTHQPVEHLAALRSIPGLLTFRPCDANEVLEMWKYILPLKDDPVAVVLSRQAVPTLDRTKYGSATGVSRGGYIIAGGNLQPQLILMATGSEVALMLEAHAQLQAEGIKVRSVSFPCLELFQQQPQEYIESVLPSSCRARVSIEAATKDTWGTYIGIDGEHVGMITFGASGPIKQLQKVMGFTVDSVTAAAKRVMERQPRTMSSEADVLRARKKRRTNSFDGVNNGS
mmetsp:Transcript_103222/g.301055  ORF Transcript_103222/g.301055 Transcript_103222/m.301055 type:complete len:743 (+) Transcript_103222:75-2303(+)